MLGYLSFIAAHKCVLLVACNYTEGYSILLTLHSKV